MGGNITTRSQFDYIKSYSPQAQIEIDPALGQVKTWQRIFCQCRLKTPQRNLLPSTVVAVLRARGLDYSHDLLEFKGSRDNEILLDATIRAPSGRGRYRLVIDLVYNVAIQKSGASEKADSEIEFLHREILGPEILVR